MAAPYLPLSESGFGMLQAGMALLFCLFAIGYSSARSTPNDKDGAKMYHLGGYPMLSAWLFFTKRYDFLCDTFKRTGQNMFRFRVLQHHVVALSGEEGRKAFFSEKNFDMEEGYRILGGPTPNPRDINVKTMDGTGAGPFAKHVLNLVRKDRMMAVIPHLLEDTNRRMDDWGKSGRLNPFEEMRDLIFQMTVRMGTCRELADDRQATARLSKLFLLHEQSISPLSLLLPWLPGRAKHTQKIATRGLFDMLSHYVDLRRKSSSKSADAMDLLIAEGYDDATTISYTLGIIFAGVVNTGMIVGWNLLYLGGQPEWKERVTAEVRDLLFNHGELSRTESFPCRFSAVPLKAWEEEMPVLDAVIKETMRFTLSGTALRRNVGGDMLVAHKTIREGDFVAYSLGDVHFSQIYPDPFSFDPARFLGEREDKPAVPFPFLGWGAGRHPCAGMRAAKLEIKLAIALFLSKFDYSVVDAFGKYPQSLPQPDRNNIQNAKPLGKPCYLKFERL